MRLNIDIQEDARLRKEIRRMIEGQITAIVRDELSEIVLGAFPAEKRTPAHLEAVVRKELLSSLTKVVSVQSRRQ